MKFYCIIIFNFNIIITMLSTIQKVWNVAKNNYNMLQHVSVDVSVLNFEILWYAIFSTTVLCSNKSNGRNTSHCGQYCDQTSFIENNFDDDKNSKIEFCNIIDESEFNHFNIKPIKTMKIYNISVLDTIVSK